MAEVTSLYTSIAEAWMAPVRASMAFWWHLPYVESKETISSMPKPLKQVKACPHKKTDNKPLVATLLLGLLLLGAVAFGVQLVDKLSARLDRLEADNQLQQQIITDLGDTLAALDKKLDGKFKYW